MHDAALLGDGGVEVCDDGDIQSDNEVDVEVASGEAEVFRRDGGAIGGNVDANEIAVVFDADVVGFVFVQANDEVLEGVGVDLEGLFGLEEFNLLGDVTAENRGGVLADLVEGDGHGDGGDELVDGRAVVDSDEDAIAVPDLFDDLITGVSGLFLAFVFFGGLHA